MHNEHFEMANVQLSAMNIQSYLPVTFSSVSFSHSCSSSSLNQVSTEYESLYTNTKTDYVSVSVTISYVR